MPNIGLDSMKLAVIYKVIYTVPLTSGQPPTWRRNLALVPPCGL